MTTFAIEKEPIQKATNTLIEVSHGLATACGWWNDIATGTSLKGKRNVGELLMLVVSEVGEAMEGHRKNKMDEHLPNRKSIEVELADAVIRIFDMAGAMELDLGGAIAEKLMYNATREDHKVANRLKSDGKKY